MKEFVVWNIRDDSLMRKFETTSDAEPEGFEAVAFQNLSRDISVSDGERQKPSTYCVVPSQLVIDREFSLVKLLHDLKLDLCARDFPNAILLLVHVDDIVGMIGIEFEDALDIKVSSCGFLGGSKE